MIDEDQETEEVINRAGYLFFTDVETFKQYVTQEVMALVEVGV